MICCDLYQNIAVFSHDLGWEHNVHRVTAHLGVMPRIGEAVNVFCEAYRVIDVVHGVNQTPRVYLAEVRPPSSTIHDEEIKRRESAGWKRMQ